jgi:hypothetical protein
MKYPGSITVIALDHPIICYPSWPSICDIIKKLLPLPDNRYDDIIKAFEAQVQGIKENDDMLLLSLQNSLKMQSDPITDNFPGTFHCEAVLATMALYSDCAIPDKDKILRQIAQVLFLPKSFSKSDPMLTGFEHWGYQGVNDMLSSLL